MSALLWCSFAGAAVPALLLLVSRFSPVRAAWMFESDVVWIVLLIFFVPAWILAAIYAIKTDEERRKAREARRTPRWTAFAGSLWLVAGIGYAIDLLQNPHGPWRWIQPAAYIVLAVIC